MSARKWGPNVSNLVWIVWDTVYTKSTRLESLYAVGGEVAAEQKNTKMGHATRFRNFAHRRFDGTMGLQLSLFSSISAHIQYGDTLHPDYGFEIQRDIGHMSNPL